MFVGRERDLRDLSALWGRDSGVLVTCRGRRRIGKSTLIEEFAAREADTFISIDGVAPRKGIGDVDQRRHFCEKIAQYVQRPVRMAENWVEAFVQLDEIIPSSGKSVVLLDEISWMAGSFADFPGYFKEAWDKRLRKHANLIFVLCGSVSAWIVENILNSTGFVGRDSLDLDLQELSPHECMMLLGPAGERMCVRERIDLLSVTGGVPKYLEEVRPEVSVDENIRRMCFMSRGMLFREFDDVFNGVFGRKMKTRGRILRMLKDGPMSAVELARRDGKTPNGCYTKMLKDLALAGFVVGDGGLSPMTGEPLREERFRIKDNYTRFYLHYIEPRRKAIERGLFDFSSLEQLHGLDGMFGYQFENLVLNNIPLLYPLLGLDQSLVLSAAPYVQRETKSHRGCQIDLLIQTQRMLMVVEIKRRREIGGSIADEVAEKVKRLQRSRDLSVRTALIYEGELSKTIAADHYFDFLIPGDKLF